MIRTGLSRLWSRVAASGRPPIRGARGPAVAYTALTGALVVTLAAAALAPTQPPPPTQPERAPESSQEVPREQTASADEPDPSAPPDRSVEPAQPPEPAPDAEPAPEPNAEPTADPTPEAEPTPTPSPEPDEVAATDPPDESGDADEDDAADPPDESDNVHQNDAAEAPEGPADDGAATDDGQPTDDTGGEPDPSDGDTEIDLGGGRDGSEGGDGGNGDGGDGDGGGDGGGDGDDGGGGDGAGDGGGDGGDGDGDGGGEGGDGGDGGDDDDDGGGNDDDDGGDGGDGGDNDPAVAQNDCVEDDNGNLRQIEDPQSPPCHPGWEGTDNGGATAQGVTADTITIANPWARPDDEFVTKAFQNLEDFFNDRFEFYGRDIDLVEAPWSTTGDWNSSEEYESNANTVATEIGAFASLGSWFGMSHAYENALADEGLISAFAVEPTVGDDHYRQHDPYQWSYAPTIDDIGTGLAGLLCDQRGEEIVAPVGDTPDTDDPLGGGDKDRKLGYVLSSYADREDDDNLDGVVDTTDINRTLEECGYEEMPTDDDDDRRVHDTYRPLPTPERVQEEMIKMRQAGVTTVICLCKVVDLRSKFMPAASNQGYYPEWVVTSFGQNDFDRYGGVASASPQQMRHAFGVSHRNRWVPTEDLPVDWAMKDVDADFEWQRGNFQQAQYWQAWRYPPLLLLATGIQQAGPELTPETFARGLQETGFPNPSGYPYENYGAGRAGFGGGHTMVDDAAAIWWDPSKESTWREDTGTWCYAHNANRWRPGELDGAGITLFDESNAVC